MKRTARIALATALLIGGGATLAVAQPQWNANYSYYAWPSYEPFYNLAPHYFPGDYPGVQPTILGPLLLLGRPLGLLALLGLALTGVGLRTQ
jgi:hypothetical protein